MCEWFWDVIPFIVWWFGELTARTHTASFRLLLRLPRGGASGGALNMEHAYGAAQATLSLAAH